MMKQLFSKAQAFAEETENAFYVCDLEEPVRRLRNFEQLLPMVEPHYAIKCNTTPQILNALNSAGIPGYDCASKGEIQTILKMGVSPDRIIFANPCKQASHIRYAKEQGVKKMTFDNPDELHKIKKIFPDAEIVLRVLTDDSRSVCRLGEKYGAHPKSTLGMLQVAKELDLNLIGVSFHVGSGCFDPTAYSDAVYVARKVFDEAEEVGFTPYLLDIGGGFSGLDGIDGAPFADIANCLRPVLKDLFPPHIRIIAEPGRYFVAACYSLSTCVIGRRAVARDGDKGEVATRNDHPTFMYYMNEGVYGSFNCVLYDHAVVSPTPLHHKEVKTPTECSIWGPTCDSMDLILKQANLPILEIGDWVYFANMGAYTMCAASNFNGFPLAPTHFI